jgi:hypothetical protein
MIANDRLANYVDDASDLFFDLQLIMRNGDPARAETVYHLAPTYNTVASSRIAGLATAGWARESIDRVIGDTYATNITLLSDGGAYGGYLYNYVVSLPWDNRPWSYGGGKISCCPEGRCTACDPVSLACSAWTGGTREEAHAACRDDVLAEAHARYDSDAVIYFCRQAGFNMLVAGS